MSGEKFCRDCRHHTAISVWSADYRCHAPQLGADLVTGEAETWPCETLRKYDFAGGWGKARPACGPAGAWFEPAEGAKHDEVGRAPHAIEGPLT
jgi:hypothetical protein